MIRDLCSMGFEFDLVLADSLYRKSGSSFVRCLQQLSLPYVLAIRSNHAMWLPCDQHVRHNRWRAYTRTFSDGENEQRYIREVIYGKRRAVRYWQLTTDKETLPSASTWMGMTHVKDITYKQVGDLYGLRNWVEYGLKQSKNELGWADLRVTAYEQIERWWEIVMSAYLMVALHTPPLHPEGASSELHSNAGVISLFRQHRDWNEARGWKNWLNNLRLVLQPWVSFNRLKPWLDIFPNPRLAKGFEVLTERMNQFRGASIYDAHELSFLFASSFSH